MILKHCVETLWTIRQHSKKILQLAIMISFFYLEVCELRGIPIVQAPFRGDYMRWERSWIKSINQSREM